LCKTKLPDTIQLRIDSTTNRDSSVTCQDYSRIINLIDVPEDVAENPYVKMDCLNVSLFKKNTSKLVYFIKLVQNPTIIGRGQTADVRLADISISRKHT
jgi:hypothetical protein